MTQFEQEQAAKKFVEFWKNKGDEKSDTQSFWISLLHDVFGVDDPTKFIEFEKYYEDNRNDKEEWLWVK